MLNDNELVKLEAQERKTMQNDSLSIQSVKSLEKY